MKSLIATSLLLCSDATRQAFEEDSSLMQGLLARHNQLSVSETQNNTRETRKDATTKLMETATNMMKNGVTPDVVTFIENTITEVNQNVLGVIVEEHHRDQTLINDLLAQFDEAIAVMEACRASVNQEHVDRTAASLEHRTCRSVEALACARSRKCEEELEQLWSIVKVEEEEMRRLHWAIHGEWCVGPAPPHPGLGDPFNWVPSEHFEGPETSQSSIPYPAVDLAANVIEFRSFSVEYFGYYMAQKPRVELAWNNYNQKLLECAALEETLEGEVASCDALQDRVREQACAHASTSHACATQFGRQYHMTLVSYNQAVTTIQQLEFDRKREWETLHIVTCLLETVYTRVIHSIDSGEPCPTSESHPEQTASEISECHVISESMTANLTIIYGDPPEPPDLPTLVAPPCTSQYLWDEHGSFPSAVQTSHTQAIEDEGLGSYFTTLSAMGWAGCAAPRACISCGSLELPADDGYVDNSVCKPHQHHLLPGQMDLGSFKCRSGDECIRASGRCNGASNCADGSDEEGCDSTWGVPAVLNREECQDPFVSDVQFRCLDSACIPIEGKCNGINNCADGSDESGCVAGTTGVTLEPTTGLTASIATPALQSQVFEDRQYTFDSLGSFTGYSYVKMSNDDKHIAQDKVQMKLRLPQPTIVYVVKLDNHELEWLSTDGWTQTALEGVSYHGIRQTRHTDWSGVLDEDQYGPGVVWQKTFPAGVVEMRGNNGGDGSYLIFLANPAHPPQPPSHSECPAGWVQVGEGGADIGGCGLQSCGERYWSNNPSECADACAARSDCRGINWAPRGGDRNHEAMTVCTLYNSDTPTSSWWGSAGHVQIFCAREGIRLSGGSATRGRVEVNHDGEWGTVCDDSFTMHDAQVACRQLGFTHAVSAIQRFGGGSGRIWMDNLACDGTQSSLEECGHNGWGSHNCGHHEDVGVECANGPIPEPQLRIVGGSNRGRLEIFYDNQWGTICDDAFGMDDANVACRQMGYTHATEAIGSFGGGSGQIWFDNVGCTGEEESIHLCEHAGWGQHNCGHNEDVGVTCVDDNEVEWTVVQGAATSPHSGVNLGADAFNAMFAACPVVRYTNPSMAGSPAVYKRHSSAGAYPGDAHALFTHLWAKQNNQFHSDFDIYPTVADARAGNNAWTFCNFADEPQPNHFTVGFPRDCGPTGYQPHIWFHATRATGLQTQGYFEIYTGRHCPSA